MDNSDFNIDSIMQSDKFKSSFARKLSSRRHVTRPMMVLKHSFPKMQLPAALQDLHKKPVQEVSKQFPKSVAVESDVSMDQNGNCTSKEAVVKDMRAEIIRLGTKVESLEWQLSQMEVDHQMHEVLLEQMTQFLERIHVSLDGKCQSDYAELLPSNKSISRSRSVHHVNKSLDQTANFESNDSISSKSSSQTLAYAAKKNQYNGFKEFVRRKSDTLIDVQYTPQKLADEAFRLLRIAQSVQSTCESVNDHTHAFHNITNCNGDERTPSEAKDSSWYSKALVGKRCAPLSRQNYGHEAFIKSLHKTNKIETHSMTEINFALDGKKSSKTNVSSTVPFEIESGFSSFNSFQDVGLPMGTWSSAQTLEVVENSQNNRFKNLYSLGLPTTPESPFINEKSQNEHNHCITDTFCSNFWQTKDDHLQAEFGSGQSTNEGVTKEDSSSLNVICTGQTQTSQDALKVYWV